MTAPSVRSGTTGGIAQGSAPLSYTLTIPGPVQAGDLGVVVVSSIYGKGAVTAPAGWTAQVTWAGSGYSTLFWVFTRKYVAGDSNPTWTWSTTGQSSLTWAWLQGADDIGAIGTLTKGTSGTASTCAAITTTATDSLVLAVGSHYYGGSGYATAAAIAPNATDLAHIFGAANYFVGVELAGWSVATSGTTTGAQTITWTAAGGSSVHGVQIEIKSPQASSPPTVAAGPDQDVILGSTVTVSATATDDGTITALTGALTTYTEGTAPTLSGTATGTGTGSAALTQTFIPTVTGAHVWTASATDNDAHTTTDTTTVTVRTRDARPVSVVSNPGSWTITGAADAAAALADTTDTTYIAGTTGAVTVAVDPWIADGHVEVTYRAAGTGPLTVDLLQGATVIATQTITPTGSAAGYTLALTDEESDTITDRTQLRIRVTAAGATTVYAAAAVIGSQVAPFDLVTLPDGTWTQTLGPAVTISAGTFEAPGTLDGAVLAFSATGGATVSYYVLPHTYWLAGPDGWIAAKILTL